MIGEKKGIEKWVRPNILSLQAYQCAREKVQGGVLLDANENPFPLARGKTRLNRYPDPFQRRLRDALASYLEVSEEMVLAGSGSDEVLDWIFKVFCTPGVDRAAVAEPTYGMYRVMADIFDVSVFEFLLEAGFTFDSRRFLAQVPEDVKLLFLCSPNNPTGNLIDQREIRSVLEAWDGVVIVDEAYLEFSGTPSMAPLVEQYPNLIVMRTFSKAFGRAGLRLGYSVSTPQLRSYFQKVKAPYNLNSITMEEGIVALRDTGEAKQQIEKIVSERKRVFRELKRDPGISRVYPSEANFILFSVPGASELCSRLFNEGIIVRDRSSLTGLDDSIRVTIGTPEENTLFLERLRYHMGTK